MPHSTFRRAGRACTGTDTEVSARRASPRRRRGVAESSPTAPEPPPSCGWSGVNAVLSCCIFHSRHRSRSAAHGIRRNRVRSSALYGRSSLGTIHGGVRWKTVSCAALAASSGMTCTPLAPVPTTATRLPVRSMSASHCEVCIRSPVKSVRPSISGYLAAPNNPPR